MEGAKDMTVSKNKRKGKEREEGSRCNKHKGNVSKSKGKWKEKDEKYVNVRGGGRREGEGTFIKSLQFYLVFYPLISRFPGVGRFFESQGCRPPRPRAISVFVSFYAFSRSDVRPT